MVPKPGPVSAGDAGAARHRSISATAPKGHPKPAGGHHQDRGPQPQVPHPGQRVQIGQNGWSNK